MTADNLYIVELCLESGTPFRRSKPMEKAKADELAKLYSDTFPTAVVPAEKYEMGPRKTETLDNIQTNNEYRSRVE